MDGSTMSGVERKKGVEADAPVLHRAGWVVPVSGPPIANGAVLVHGGVIRAVGAFEKVKAERTAGVKLVDHGYCALLPALVNAHTHLELTSLDKKIHLPQESFAAWLRVLFAHRASLTEDELQIGFEEGKRRMTSGGIGLYGDITNRFPARGGATPLFPESQVFVEVLGFDQLDVETALGAEGHRAFERAAIDDPSLSLAAHATYSTSPELIKKAKNWCRERGSTFSIHVAEHSDEIQFLRDGTGFCRSLLQSLGKWSPRWTVPRMTPVQYLKDLGVLDAQTLLVHLVHMTESDWQTVAEHACPVCFCPRSNHNLGVGRADMEKALHLGIVACIGTDSLASNADLSLFNEASYILESYPQVTPEAVLTMMTMGGARALQRDGRFGSIQPGKRSALLAVSLPDSLREEQLIEAIIHQGKKGAWQWANSPTKN